MYQGHLDGLPAVGPGALESEVAPHLVRQAFSHSLLPSVFPRPAAKPSASNACGSAAVELRILTGTHVDHVFYMPEILKTTLNFFSSLDCRASQAWPLGKSDETDGNVKPECPPVKPKLEGWFVRTGEMQMQADLDAPPDVQIPWIQVLACVWAQTRIRTQIWSVYFGARETETAEIHKLSSSQNGSVAATQCTDVAVCPAHDS